MTEPTLGAPAERHHSRTGCEHSHQHRHNGYACTTARGPKDGRTRSDRSQGQGCQSHGGCHQHHHSNWGGERVQLGFAVAAMLLLVAGWLVRWIDSTSVAGGYLLALSMVFGGFFAAIDAVTGILARRFQIDFLMVLAALGAAYIGHAIEGALLLVLFSLGHAAEHYAMGRAQRSIEALSELRPTSATLLDPASGQTRDVPIEELQVGDVVVVRPDSRIAADGVVVFGASSVDQAAVTGESIPVDKTPVPRFNPLVDDWHSLPSEHKLYAGTINGGGAMQLRVTRTADDMTLARVIRMVTDAKTLRSPTQRLTASFERYFVPAVLVLVSLLMLAFLVIDEPFSNSLYRAIGVLVAASPCALALATPSAVLSAVARGGRDGVLFKGGGPLEQLGQVEAIAFDKTGTLTVGKPAVVDCIVAPGQTQAYVLGIAAAVERLSDHPLAHAIVSAAEERYGTPPAAKDVKQPAEFGARLPIAQNAERLTGFGMRAICDGLPVWVGNARMFAQGTDDANWSVVPLPDWVKLADQELQQRGRTTMIVRQGDRFLGVIGLLDTPRPSAASLAKSLRQLGISQLVMLSGDNQQAAQAIADQVGIDQVYGGLSPEDKLRLVSEISQHRPIAMIGDGVNDAPALAAATVSVAMGAAGSDVALETADVALMADDLSKLPFAVALSRQASRIIRQNLWISLGMIAVLVPAALFGLNLVAAVVFHEGSTLLVVANALRLLSFRPSPAG